MIWRCALVIAVLLGVVAGTAGELQAGEPTDQLRSEIEQLYRSAQQPAPARASDRTSTEILDQMFDWPRMAKTVLRRHWDNHSAAEQAEFTTLFAGLFRRAYVSRINLVDASKFQYLGDQIDGNRATVKTKVSTKRGSTLDVDYAVRLGEGQRWRVEDVLVDRISLMDNYRNQFDAFLARQPYEALVQKLRAAGTPK
jgi:phospholipid transport system substrate-binding protein